MIIQPMQMYFKITNLSFIKLIKSINIRFFLFNFVLKFYSKWQQNCDYDKVDDHEK